MRTEYLHKNLRNSVVVERIYLPLNREEMIDFWVKVVGLNSVKLVKDTLNVIL